MRWAVGCSQYPFLPPAPERDTGALGERFDLCHLGDSVEIRIRDNGTGIPAAGEGEAVQSLLYDQACR